MEAVLYLTDKNNKPLWCTSATYGYHQGERANLERHLTNIQNAHPQYQGLLEPDSAKLLIEVNGETVFDSSATADISADDLLAELRA